MTVEVVRQLQSIDNKLSALLAVATDELTRQKLDRERASGRHRPRSFDRMLTDAGITGAETGRILGKSPQAVSQALAREKASGQTKKKVSTDGE